MAFMSSSYTINCNITPIPNALPKLSLQRNLPKVYHLSTNSQISPSPFSLQPAVIQTRYRSSFPLVPFDAKNSSGISGGDDHDHDHRALETVQKLYSAIKNQNFRELSDIIGDKCRCVCDFFSLFQPFQGKKQVVDFFSYLIRSLGNNIEFVVNPTLENGMNVGVVWRLVTEWNNTHAPLGKGFSFYISQIYEGKALIRNVEMFMEPLFHIEPYRLKMMGYMTAILDKINPYKISKGFTKKRLYTSVFVLVFVVLILLFSKPGFY